MGEGNKVYTKVLSKNLAFVIPTGIRPPAGNGGAATPARAPADERSGGADAAAPRGSDSNNNRGAHLRLDEWMCVLTDDILRVNTAPPW